MATKKQKEAAKKAFKVSKSLGKVFVTEDGQCFIRRNYAEMHCLDQNLEKKNIYEVASTDIEVDNTEESASNKKSSAKKTSTKAKETKPEESKEEKSETPKQPVMDKVSAAKQEDDKK